MRIIQLPVGPFEMNAYIVAGKADRECVLIDPGDEPERIIEQVNENKLKPTAILLTHCHLDHAWKVEYIKRHFKIPLYIGEADVPLLESINDQAAMFNFGTTDIPQPDVFFSEAEPIEVGSLNIHPMHTPGHSPGSFCLRIHNAVFAGDVLFKESIGRTDLYGGSFPDLIHSIRTKLLLLPDSTEVYPGHGPSTTIGYEKKHNPFLNPERIPFT